MAKISHEDFVKKVYDLVGDEYTVLSEYTDSRLKVKFRHNVKNCGKQFDMRASHFTTSITMSSFATDLPTVVEILV